MAKTYIVQVNATITETYKVLADNVADATENWSDGEEVSWDQIESDVLSVEIEQ